MTFSIDPVSGISAPAAVLTTPLPKTSGGSGVATSVQLAQIVTFSTGAVATGTTIIPLDDTIPQNTEGDQYLSLAITPTNAASTLEIDITWNAMTSSISFLTAALFQDAVLNAMAAQTIVVSSANWGGTGTIKYTQIAGTTSATTFKLRIGASSASTTTFNGQSAGRLFGGVFASRITIKEYLP